MKFPNSIKFLLALGFLIAFVLLSKYEDRQMVRDIDFAVTVRVQDVIDRSSRLRLKALTVNTLEGAVFFAGPLLTSCVTLLLTIFVFRKQKLLALIIPLSFALIVGIEFAAKEMVHHPPPPFFMIKNPTTLFPKYHLSEEYSFPSGHAARAMFLSVVSFALLQQCNTVTMKKRFAIGFGLGLYICFVSVSKIYLGHHWFSDIVAGYALGGFFGLLTLFACCRYK